MKIIKDIWFILTIDCRKASSIISKMQDSTPGTVERFALKLHLLYCRYCCRYKKQLSFLNILFQKFISMELYENIIPKHLSSKKKQEIKDIVSKEK